MAQDPQFLRLLNNYTDYGGVGAGAYDTGDPRANPYNLWDDMEEVMPGDPRFNRNTNYMRNVESGDSMVERYYVPRAGSVAEQVHNRGAITRNGVNNAGSVANGLNYQGLGVDWDAMPKTPFGTARNIMNIPVGADRVRDSNMVVNDNNYGNYTHPANWNSGSDWIGPALMAVASMGMGGLWGAVGGAAASSAGRLGMSAVNLGRSAGSGNFNPFSLAGTALGMVPGVGQFSRFISPAMSAARFAQSRRRGRGG